ncbi:MAG: hypothetical protein D6704_05670 [Nitrospirae bacterium]|nr:MAG: hypothetical protein D6704_05670 [Nitrospirota bacterium]
MSPLIPEKQSQWRCTLHLWIPIAKEWGEPRLSCAKIQERLSFSQIRELSPLGERLILKRRSVVSHRGLGETLSLSLLGLAKLDRACLQIPAARPLLRTIEKREGLLSILSCENAVMEPSLRLMKEGQYGDGYFRKSEHPRGYGLFQRVPHGSSWAS